jgi:hypothetical protein
VISLHFARIPDGGLGLVRGHDRDIQQNSLTVTRAATSSSIPRIPSTMLVSGGSKLALLRSSQLRAARTFTTTLHPAKPNATASTSSPALRSEQARPDDAPFIPLETVVGLPAKDLRKGSSEYRRQIRVSTPVSLHVSLLICYYCRPSLRSMMCSTRVHLQLRPNPAIGSRAQ